TEGVFAAPCRATGFGRRGDCLGTGHKRGVSLQSLRISMNKFHYCNSAAHGVTRRQFLGATGASLLAGPALFSDNVVMGAEQAADAKRQGKAVIILYLGGGASQLETWDPKPGRPTGGPYGAIPTSVPGVCISELLPKIAKVMHHMAIVRSVDNSSMGADHNGTGMHIGRK